MTLVHIKGAYRFIIHIYSKIIVGREGKSLEATLKDESKTLPIKQEGEVLGTIINTTHSLEIPLTFVPWLPAFEIFTQSFQ